MIVYSLMYNKGLISRKLFYIGIFGFMKRTQSSYFNFVKNQDEIISNLNLSFPCNDENGFHGVKYNTVISSLPVRSREIKEFRSEVEFRNKFKNRNRK